MREERFGVAAFCVSAMLLGVASETLAFAHPPLSDCAKLAGLSVCPNPAREASLPPHVHTTTSNSSWPVLSAR